MLTVCSCSVLLNGSMYPTANGLLIVNKQCSTGLSKLISQDISAASAFVTVH